MDAPFGSTGPPTPPTMPAASHDCPRCGYDLGGVVRSWSDRCPLEGICTECGMPFQWTEIVSALYRVPDWSVEYASGRIDFLARCLKTAARTAVPWSFWRTLLISSPIRWVPIAVYLTLLALAFCLAIAIGSATSDMLADGSLESMLLAAVLPFGEAQFLHHHLFALGMFISSGFTLHLLCAAGFAALPISRRRAKVRWRHIGRVTSYGLAVWWPLHVIVMAELAFAALPIPRMILASLSWVFGSLILPFEVIWWSTASGRYLRMSHAWAVGVSIVAMASTATIAIFFWGGLLLA